MYVIEPVKHSDIDDLMALAIAMAPGITTFPPSIDVLKNKIVNSIDSFTRPTDDHVTPRNFLLVLRDLETNKVIGTAGVFSHIGHDTPFYSYKRVVETFQSTIKTEDAVEHVSNQNTSLHLTHDMNGGTEVGTLLLLPEYAGKGLGKYLAKCRYLLIKTFIILFREPVFAELRGWTEEGDESPFWNSVGRKFMDNMDFAKADYLSAVTDKQFIADLFPKHPIYEALLPAKARNCINKANSKGQAALNMLYKEGFQDEGYVDIFDAGATVTAKFDHLQTIRDSISILATEGDVQANKQRILVSNQELNSFRVIMTDEYSLTDTSVTLKPSSIKSLSLQASNKVTICKL